MSTKLFRKVADVTIGNKKFTYPPFTIEFEAHQYFSQFTTAKVRLYNPNDETIGSCDPKTTGNKVEPTRCVVNAGYEGNIQKAIDGFITKYDVFRDDKNRILEMTISDDKEWLNEKINKPFENQKVSTILNEITGGKSTDIELGDDVTLDRYYVTTVIRALKGPGSLTRLSKSQFSFRNGILTIRPQDKFNQREIFLNYTTGLVGTPEKITRKAIYEGKKLLRPAYTGYKIKTLYLPQLSHFESVKIQTFSNDPNKENIDFAGKVEKVDSNFSTFEDAVSEYELSPRTERTVS